jgi:beta-glucosidase
MESLLFPKNFVFGCGTASYQVEGATKEGGRTSSIWDDYCRKDNAIIDGSSGDVACDQYHRYKDDIKIMESIGFNEYRFSISWTRIFPKANHKVNMEGINYYINLCKYLLESNIKPIVTLYHWDLPSYYKNSWVDRSIVEEFAFFAATVFEYLSPYVDKWITINEPHSIAFNGYLYGIHAPGQKNINSALTVAHNLNLSHARAVQIFREKGYRGSIGIALDASWPKPATKKNDDLFASTFARNLYTDIFLYPLCGKDYPSTIKEITRFSMPVKAGDKKLMAEKFDYIGLNYYSQSVVEYDESSSIKFRDAKSWRDENCMGWPIDPKGMRRMLNYYTQLFPNLPIVISENGFPYPDVVVDRRVHDTERIKYLSEHLAICIKAIEDGIPITGYYIWSILDNFEWMFGYTKRFGIVHTDYATQKRTLKDSAYFMRDVIAGNVD